jgi:hypothetical protein
MRMAFFLAAALVSLGATNEAPPKNSGPEQEASLQEVALAFAQAWVDGDGEALEGMMETGGIRLHLLGEEHLVIPPRQARRSLMSFLERYEGGEAEVPRASQIGGDPTRGFAEIRWGCRVSGTPEPVIFTLFVAFARTGAEWRVTEIRILP